MTGDAKARDQGWDLSLKVEGNSQSQPATVPRALCTLVPYSVSLQPRTDAPGGLSDLWELFENKPATAAAAAAAAECRPLWLLHTEERGFPQRPSLARVP